MDIQVIKKDGTAEPYDEAKIARVAIAAGLTPDEGQVLASNITKWIIAESLTKVNSMDIRNKVVEGLKIYDQYAANMYMWYEKTKDNSPIQTANTVSNH